MMLSVTPDDVYSLVYQRHDRVEEMVAGIRTLVIVATTVVCSLLLVQITAKIFIFAKVLIQSRRVELVLSRCELVLSAAEAHGEITDRNKDRTEKALEKVEQVTRVQANHLFTEAQRLEVIDKNVVEIKEVVKPSGDGASGVIVIHQGDVPRAGG